MIFTKRMVLPLVAVLAPVALSACSSADMQMPTGYTYHNEIYKAPPGPEASPPAKLISTTSAASAGNGGAISLPAADGSGLSGDNTLSTQIGGPETYAAAADDLVARMLRNFGRPMEPVLVKDSSVMAGALKSSLTRNGVPVAANPGDGPFVLDNSVQGQTATIQFISNHDPVTSETGSYPVVQ